MAAARTTVHVGAYVPPEQAARFAAAAGVAGQSLSDALRAAIDGYAEAVHEDANPVHDEGAGPGRPVESRASGEREREEA